MTSLRLGLGAFALTLGLVFPFLGARPALAADALEDVANEGIIFAGSALCGAGSDEAACNECRENGNCSLEQLLQVFVNLANFTLGISGTVLLFVFVYGGFKWLLSRGDPKWVESGKAAMTGGVIGIVIIFGAYVAINVILAGIKSGNAPTTNLEGTLTAPPTGGTEGSTNIPFTTE